MNDFAEPTQIQDLPHDRGTGGPFLGRLLDAALERWEQLHGISEPSFRGRQCGRWSRFKQHAISGASTVGGFCGMWGLPGMALELPIFYLKLFKALVETCEGFGLDPRVPEERTYILHLLAIGHLPSVGTRLNAVRKLNQGIPPSKNRAFLWSLPRRVLTAALPVALTPRWMKFAARMALNSTSQSRLVEATLNAAQIAYSERCPERLPDEVPTVADSTSPSQVESGL
jgi:hypothetical protein